jgi:hypothetical protein
MPRGSDDDDAAQAPQPSRVVPGRADLFRGLDVAMNAGGGSAAMVQARLTRRAVVRGAAGAAAGFASAVAVPQAARAHPEGRAGRRQPVPPEPIPGGIELAPDQVIHVWAPGPPELTLPFTGATLQGFDTEPTTIKDFKGFAAVAFHAGTARAGDGTPYDFETDVRAFQGTYIDRTGTRRYGTFGFI